MCYARFLVYYEKFLVYYASESLMCPRFHFGQHWSAHHEGYHPSALHRNENEVEGGTLLRERSLIFGRVNFRSERKAMVRVKRCCRHRHRRQRSGRQHVGTMCDGRVNFVVCHSTCSSKLSAMPILVSTDNKSPTAHTRL